MRRIGPALLAFALVVAAAGGVFFAWQTWPWLFSASYTLKIATYPTQSDYGKFTVAFRHEVADEHPGVRFVNVPVPDIRSSALALKNREVDLAVVRSDDPNAAGGRAVFVIRKLFAAVMVPAGASAESMADLKDGHIGVLVTRAATDPLQKAILDFYKIDEKRTVRLGLAELTTALKGRHVAAVLAVGPTGGGDIADAVQVFRKVTRKPPDFIDLGEAEAIAAHYPVYAKVELPDGAFGGTPAAPSDDVTTVAASVLMVARPTLSNYAAGELTRLLLATKSKVAALLPQAGELGAPPTDRDTVMPAHPGTIAYLDGSAPDLLAESLSYLTYGSVFTGVVGSLAAWLAALRNRRQIRELQANVARLPTLLADARAPEPHKLDATEAELEQLSEWFVEKYVADEITADVFNDASTRVTHIRALIHRRRATLAAASAKGEAKPSAAA